MTILTNTFLGPLLPKTTWQIHFHSLLKPFLLCLSMNYSCPP